ncbi:alpha/beta hydrolase [Marivita sp. S6314]|uniref:alpha/beta fold hydrolase n=1 Tax=Marivita sp. S6314 TaxID=2926406 RepID=UPI001FF1E5CA|nr:alpha/beta hydrolase [Marivita sp. S6314]MCK0150855.1 alpha/beta hydrolase [Marivita sp. S6314]
MTLAARHLAYDCTGTGARVVLLHPIGLDRRFWARMADELKGELELCAFDLPGHGTSPITDGSVSIEGLAAAVEDTMRTDGLGPAIVVGCSLGGMIAQALATRAPDLVRGLVLANTNFTQTEQGRAAMRQRAAEARKGMNAVVDTCLERWFAPDVAAADPKGMALIREMLLAGDPDVHARCWEAIGNLDLGAVLPTITVPCLVVAGGDDRSIPAEKSRALAGLLPRATLHTIEGAGHLTPFERPADFAELLRHFALKLADEQMEET